MPATVKMPGNVDHPAQPQRETTQPAVDSDQRDRRTTKSLIFYYKDRASGLRFLVDTCAEISVIPPSIERKHRQD